MAISIQNQSAGRKSASISMAPMIDMVFLLLVFFMTASAMSQAGNKLELDLPESVNAKVAKDFSNRLILSIDEQGQVFLGTRRVEEKELPQLLADFKNEQAAGKVSIRAAKSTPFSAVKAVMAAAASVGIVDYLYASYETGGES